MKQSTTQDRAYLAECLKFHEKRLAFFSMLDLDGDPCKCVPCTEKRAYHRAQAKWFKAKLQGYFREAPIPAPTRSTMPTSPSLEFKATRIPAPPAPIDYNTNYYQGESIPVPAFTTPDTPIPTKKEPWYIRAYNKLRGF